MPRMAAIGRAVFLLSVGLISSCWAQGRVTGSYPDTARFLATETMRMVGTRGGETSFSRVDHIQVDRDGVVYVLDSSRRKIVSFAPTGRYDARIDLRTPFGEDATPTTFGLVDSLLIVGYSGTISGAVFSGTGDLQKTFRIESFFPRLVLGTPDGGIILGNLVFDVRSHTKGVRFDLYDDQFNFQHTIVEKRIPSWATQWTFDWFDGVVVGERLYVVGLTSKSGYEMEIYDWRRPDGLLAWVRLPAPGYRLSQADQQRWMTNLRSRMGDEEAERYRHMMVPPDSLPSVSGIHLSPTGTIWVQQTGVPTHSSTVFDERSLDGTFVRRVLVSNVRFSSRLVVAAYTLYDVVTREGGPPVICGYKLVPSDIENRK